jgi:hypothetical protein
MQSFHKYSFPSAGNDTLTPMIDRRDQYGSIEKESGDLGRCQNLERVFDRTTNEVGGHVWEE